MSNAGKTADKNTMFPRSLVGSLIVNLAAKLYPFLFRFSSRSSFPTLPVLFFLRPFRFLQ